MARSGLHLLKMKLLRPATLVLLLAAAVAAPAANPQDDYTGQYNFLRDGEYIQLIVQHGELSGWVTTFGFLDSDRDEKIDRFFKQATLHGTELYFITKPIHGSWLEFSGHIERSRDVATRTKEGYYQLIGTLTEYTSDEQNKVSAQSRQVDFKSQADNSFASQ